MFVALGAAKPFEILAFVMLSHCGLSLSMLGLVEFLIASETAVGERERLGKMLGVLLGSLLVLSVGARLGVSLRWIVGSNVGVLDG